MVSSTQSAPAASARRESPRIRLARVATAAARSEAGVTGLDGGTAGRHTTFAGTEPLPGVTVFADGERYDVALYLTAEPTDLHALAARCEQAVRRAAADAGLGSALGDVHLTFTDLTLPAEMTSP